uniref:Uncharacterized protein n=1 Tax=Arundo donax TaxID=35708 RepID=A0A0A9D0M4_ARUDO
MRLVPARPPVPSDAAVDGRPLPEGIHGLLLVRSRSGHRRQGQLRVGLVERRHRRRRRRSSRTTGQEPSGGYEFELRVVHLGGHRLGSGHRTTVSGTSSVHTSAEEVLQLRRRRGAGYGGELRRGAPLLLLQITMMSEGEVEPWIVVRGVHDARGQSRENRR